MSKTLELFESIQNNLKEPEKYACYEEPFNGKKKTKEQWKKYYDKNIDKDSWETFEDWWYDMTERSRLIIKESEESTLLKSYQETDYGYHNNATMIYGELNDGNWYVYIPDNDAFDIYNEPITNKFIDCSYNYQTDDDKADDTWYDNFVKEHEITKNYNNDIINKIISELDHKYFGDDFID